LASAEFIISFLEQENEQLKAKQLLLEKDLFKASMKDVKGKKVEAIEDSEKYEG